MQTTPIDDSQKSLVKKYWRKNLRIMSILLLFWMLLGIGCGILWADWLNQFNLPGTGYPLGFWFAQQGSIIGFVIIILIYAVIMNRLDDTHHVELATGEDKEGK